MTPAVSSTARPSIPPQIFSIPLGVTAPYADFTPPKVISSTDIFPELEQQADEGITQETEQLSPPGEVAWILDGMLTRHDAYKASMGTEQPHSTTCKPLLPTLIASKAAGRGRPSKGMVNSLKPYLTFYDKARDALDELPLLDDIVTGVVQLNLDGNTRALNKGVMIEMLQDLNVITSDAVENWMECGKRHAQKVATCLRLIVTLSLRIIHLWPEPFEEERWSN